MELALLNIPVNGLYKITDSDKASGWDRFTNPTAEAFKRSPVFSKWVVSWTAALTNAKSSSWENQQYYVKCLHINYSCLRTWHDSGLSEPGPPCRNFCLTEANSKILERSMERKLIILSHHSLPSPDTMMPETPEPATFLLLFNSHWLIFLSWISLIIF